ncbi:MAG: precorrin-8X methylmutase [Lachnospiraceae bacterium]|nr:precorrin-8X methylmutase [Lachnospiraceae bacterium]
MSNDLGREYGIEKVAPADIEKESMATIKRELSRELPADEAPVTMRVIHTTADFEFADLMYYSKDAIERAKEAIKNGCKIVTDTNMAAAGISKRTAERFGCKVECYMADEDVAKKAKEEGCTRARICMDKGAEFGENVIYAIGNAPTALVRLREMIDDGYKPACIIGVPVGFVNVVRSKELIMETDVPCIIAKGRKGGSTIAACIVNALLYELDHTRGM